MGGRERTRIKHISATNSEAGRGLGLNTGLEMRTPPGKGGSLVIHASLSAALIRPHLAQEPQAKRNKGWRKRWE